MARKQLFICDLLQRREIGSLHRNEIHQLTEASTGLADKLLVHNNVIKVMISALLPCTVTLCEKIIDGIRNVYVFVYDELNNCITKLDDAFYFYFHFLVLYKM